MCKQVLKHLLLTLFIILCSVLSSCSVSAKHSNNSNPVNVQRVSYKQLGKIKYGKIIITKEIDLKGAVCEIPHKYTLVFKGGSIKNGSLFGNNTKISYVDKIFNHVKILGSWNVPQISTSMFVDLDYENSLQSVFSLANPEVNNSIIIESGEYVVTAFHNGEKVLTVVSNTDVEINGIIRLNPNDFTNYGILYLHGEHITIHGNGTVIGDKHTHTGTKGEWGMGVSIHECSNVNVSGIKIQDCWGDCIYIGTKSTDVVIDGCTLTHGRRQGISITSANDVVVRNCLIKNVGGTAPEYAIDLEPNHDDIVDNILIDGVKVVNCKGGFCAYGTANGASIGNITIRNCDVTAEEKMTIAMVKCGTVLIEKNTLVRKNDNRVIACDQIGNIIVQNNILKYKSKSTTGDKKAVKSSLGAVTAFNCGKRTVEGNRELKN